MSDAAERKAQWRRVLSVRLKSRRNPAVRYSVAVMGTNGRGMDHIQSYLAQPNVEIACISDVDSRAINKGIAAVVKQQANKPRGMNDFREVLEDKSLDVLSIAAPSHWHAPAAILACPAGNTFTWRNPAVTIRTKAN